MSSFLYHSVGSQADSVWKWILFPWNTVPTVFQRNEILFKQVEILISILFSEKKKVYIKYHRWMFILDIISWRLILSEHGIYGFWCRNRTKHVRFQYIPSLGCGSTDLPTGVSKAMVLPTQMRLPTKKVLLS